MADIVAKCAAEIGGSRAHNHPFLRELRASGFDRDCARSFAAQWFKAALAHKQSFPGLVYSSTLDEIRLQLIEILREEYGFGEKDQIHSVVLERFLRALGLEAKEVILMPAEPEINAFAKGIDGAWAHGEPVSGFGVHFALEYLAARMHQFFYVAVSTIPGIEQDDIEYFKLHNAVEIQHCSTAMDGIRVLATDPANADRLLNGVRRGIQLVDLLLDGLHRAYRKAGGSNAPSFV